MEYKFTTTEELISDLQEEADLCQSEGALDIARLCEAAADELQRLRRFEIKMTILQSMRPLTDVTFE